MINQKMYDYSKITIKDMLESYNPTKMKIVLEPIDNPILTKAEIRLLMQLAHKNQLIDNYVFNAVNEILNNWDIETVLNKVLVMNILKYFGKLVN